MDLHYKQEVRVGALLLVGIGLFLAGTMWLRGKSFSKEPTIPVQFEDVGTLKRGSPVKISGVTLGKVTDIEFRDVGNVLVKITLEKQIKPKTDASAVLATVGLVADAVIYFNPGTSAQLLPAGQVIKGTAEKGLTGIGTDLAEQAKQTLNNVRDLTGKRLADDIHETMVVMRRLMAFYSDRKEGPTAEIQGSLQSLQRLSTRLDSTLAQAELSKTLRRSDTLMTSLTVASDQMARVGQSIDSVLAKINNGTGTMGKLVTDTTLYHELRELTISVKGFMDELKKNPGKIPIQVKIF
ncbi:MAG: MlaD family protein [Gemmatimonadota bacterium]